MFSCTACCQKRIKNIQTTHLAEKRRCTILGRDSWKHYLLQLVQLEPENNSPKIWVKDCNTYTKCSRSSNVHEFKKKIKIKTYISSESRSFIEKDSQRNVCPVVTFFSCPIKWMHGLEVSLALILFWFMHIEFTLQFSLGGTSKGSLFYT